MFDTFKFKANMMAKCSKSLAHQACCHVQNPSQWRNTSKHTEPTLKSWILSTYIFIFPRYVIHNKNHIKWFWLNVDPLFSSSATLLNMCVCVSLDIYIQKCVTATLFLNSSTRKNDENRCDRSEPSRVAPSAYSTYNTNTHT